MVGRVFASVVLGTLVLGSAGLVWKSAKAEILPVGALAPALEFQTADGRQDHVSITGTRTVIVFYARGCEHCRAELTTLDQQVARTAGSTVFLISPGNQSIPDSTAMIWPRLAHAPNVVWGHASLEALEGTFGLRVVPTILVFDSSRHLTAKYRGETKLDLLFPATCGDTCEVR